MRQSRLNAVESIRIESPLGLEDDHRWFYGQVGALEEGAGSPQAGIVLTFRSARVELMIIPSDRPLILDVRRRLTLSVPSLEEAAELLDERRHEVARLSGLGWTDRRVRTRDPAGNVVEFKQAWPEAPL